MACPSVIRRWALREEVPIGEIARRTRLSRDTVHKYLRSGTVELKSTVPKGISKLDVHREVSVVAEGGGGRVAHAATYDRAVARRPGGFGIMRILSPGAALLPCPEGRADAIDAARPELMLGTRRGQAACGGRRSDRPHRDRACGPCRYPHGYTGGRRCAASSAGGAEPGIIISRRHRRTVPSRLEPPRRSAMAHHVHRPAPLGSSVLINGKYYNLDCTRRSAIRAGGSAIDSRIGPWSKSPPEPWAPGHTPTSWMPSDGKCRRGVGRRQGHAPEWTWQWLRYSDHRSIFQANISSALRGADGT